MYDASSVLLEIIGAWHERVIFPHSYFTSKIKTEKYRFRMRNSSLESGNKSEIENCACL